MHQGHGGNRGFSHKIWHVDVKEDNDNVTLKFISKSLDGEENYPGNLDVCVSFKIYEDYRIEEIYEAMSDKTTLVNMTNHSYFNLSGDIKRTITQCNLKVDSDEILELDYTCVPTGKKINVGNTPFDFRTLKNIGKDIDKEITGNGPKLHTLIKEMNRETFGDKNLLTVGETWGVTPDIAKLYSNPNGDELSMVFQFEHIGLDEIKGKSKWDLANLDFVELKKVFSKWQAELEGRGWNSLFWNNHDLPRIVSRWGNDKGEYRKLSAKMLAIILHMQKGTPYIYQGEEIGMTNVKFDSIEDYKDIETLNMYKERIDKGYDRNHIMNSIYVKSRDNARTPMQWSREQNGGFTKGIPWIRVNENYKDINVDEALRDKDSVFYHYKALINLRKENDVIIYGTYNCIDINHKAIYSYVRELNGIKFLVVANFYDKIEKFILPQNIHYDKCQLILSNYKDSNNIPNEIVLRPYEALIYKLI